MPKTTKQMIAELLVENTGTHFLDSGGAYGRHWQRNQGMTLEAWEAQPAAWLDKYDFYNHSVFHWLVDRVEYNERLDNILQKYFKQPDHLDHSWLECVNEFLDALSIKPHGIYGEGEPVWEYTYNQENNLTQDVQFGVFTLNDDAKIKIKYQGKSRTYTIPADSYAIVQIHGGCDARGGFTKPRLFSAESDALFDAADGYVQCIPPAYEQPVPGQIDLLNVPAAVREAHHWYTDNNYTWYPRDWESATLHTEDFVWDEENEYFKCPECDGKMEAL